MGRPSNQDVFIKVWNESTSLEEVGRRLNIKPASASMRATKLRQKGIELKFMSLQAQENVDRPFFPGIVVPIETWRRLFPYAKPTFSQIETMLEELLSRGIKSYEEDVRRRQDAELSTARVARREREILEEKARIAALSPIEQRAQRLQLEDIEMGISKPLEHYVMRLQEAERPTQVEPVEPAPRRDATPAPPAAAQVKDVSPPAEPRRWITSLFD